jgi:hypothetical protein
VHGIEFVVFCPKCIYGLYATYRANWPEVYAEALAGDPHPGDADKVEVEVLIDWLRKQP